MPRYLLYALITVAIVFRRFYKGMEKEPTLERRILMKKNFIIDVSY